MYNSPTAVTIGLWTQDIIAQIIEMSAKTMENPITHSQFSEETINFWLTRSLFLVLRSYTGYSNPFITG